MQKGIILLVGISALFVGCDSPKNQKDFANLAEEEKRLAENALSSMQVANGLEIELFAAEPMIVNPTNISVDSRGRVWVCEAPNYDVAPEKADSLGNRITVLEDTDQDGRADKRTIFYQSADLFLPLGVTVLGEKIFVTGSPHVLVFTDKNADLIPESKEILFTRLHKGEHSAHALLPGPDGMLYFSLGNYTRDMADADGKRVVDKAGINMFEADNPYIGGMVVRSTVEGKRVEVLGHNFRNNYEPCIDSYGNIWQSDNDDDGNESARVNFVMYYGNYGFLDEMSRASWTTGRVNLEKTIPERHWHQNDPGVVPNVLITGAGSPAGMTYYEGDLLPEIFRNVPIHAEPYHNTVRAYVPAKKGAGYTLEIEELVKSEDRWFRPVDVAVAPDGSLFIADWYDPILGGGAAADAKQGRIYRVAPAVDKYVVSVSDFSSIDGATEGLKSPNPETRFAAFRRLEQAGHNGYTELHEMWKSESPMLRARALWLLAKLDKSGKILKQALVDDNADIRIAGIRAVAMSQQDVVSSLIPLANDDDAGVRREIALALRYDDSQEAADLWVTLARHYNGRDRWYLEALGIGADLHADLFFNTWLQKVDEDLNNKAHQDLIWRSRSSKALPLLAEMIRATQDPELYHRYFRAFDFHTSKSKTDVLTSLVSLPRADHKNVTALALQQMEAKDIVMTSKLRTALEEALEQTKGTLAFLKLVEKFSIKERQLELLEIATSGNEQLASVATDLLLKFNAIELLSRALHTNDSSSLMLLQSLKGKGSPQVIDLITSVVQDEKTTLAIKQAAIQVMGSSWPGEEKLLSLVKEDSFLIELKPTAAAILFNVYRSKIQREAAEHLKKPLAKGTSLPPIKQLVASAGNYKNGQLLFQRYCKTCHKVENDGAGFGPDLTLIGEKLSKEGLFRSVLYPNEGVSFGYESTLVTLDDGTESMGIVDSETSSEITLKLPGGTSVKYSRNKVAEIQKRHTSLMPDLASAMSESELVDLVEYLALLKKN